MALALTFLGGLAAGAFVAVLTHGFTSRRDRANRQSEMRIQFLLHAYRLLADASNRDLQRNPDDARAFEQAVEDVQLLGTKAQAEKARDLATVMASEGGASPDDLLRTLRADLREELGLSPISDGPLHLRFNRLREG